MVFSLEIFDLLSPEITLYYKGKHRHSSNISGILSIISIIITLIFTFIFLEDLKRKNPSAFYYNRYIQDIKPIPYNSSGLFHLINLTIINFPYEINRMFTIVGIDRFIYSLDFNDTESFDHYIYDYCEENDIKGIENTILENSYEFIKSFCLKRFYNKTTQKIYNLNNYEYPYPQIINLASHPQATLYGIVVEKCKNSTIINNNNCYSNEIIDEIINYLINYNIGFLDHNILIDNYKNPNSNIFHSINNLFSIGIGYTTNHLNFLPTMLRTNKGYVLDDEVNLNSYKFSFNEKLTTLFSEEENPNKDIYAVFYFWLQNQEDTFVRSYKKIQDILGSINGLAKVIFLCAKLLNILFHNFTYINELNHDMKNHYKFIIDKTISINNSLLNHNKLDNTLQNKKNSELNNIDNSKVNNTDNIKLNNTDTNKLNNIDKSNIHINYEIGNINIVNEKLKRINNNHIFKVSFFRIIKTFIFKKKDEFINKLVKLREFIISEEIMFKYYLIIHLLKNPIFEHNNILKDLDLFKEDNFEINQNINNRK